MRTLLRGLHPFVFMTAPMANDIDLTEAETGIGFVCEPRKVIHEDMDDVATRSWTNNDELEPFELELEVGESDG